MTRQMRSFAAVGVTAVGLCAAPTSLIAQEKQAEDTANRKSIVQADEETRKASTARIDQTGALNRADGDVGDAANFTFFDGTGLSLEPANAGIYQDGECSTSLIRQFGTANHAAIRQADPVGGGADASVVRILQGESGGRSEDGIALVDQKGDGSSVTIEQNGTQNRSFAAQTGNLGPDAFDEAAVQEAKDASEIPVSQGGNKQTQKISGNANESQVAQDGTGLEAEVSLLNSEGDAGRISQRGVGHKASYSAKSGGRREGEIVQNGSVANNADADITGDDHRAEIRQEGNGGRSTASLVQAGKRHEAAIRQAGAKGDESGNEASVDQAGDGNSGRVAQTEGAANVADIGQEGETSSGLTATVQQSGAGGTSKADIDQTGRKQSARIEQSGKGGGSIAAIDQSTDGSRDNDARTFQEIDATAGTDTIDIDQGGNANRANARQTRSEGGSGSVATLAQPGAENRVNLQQDGPGHVANSSQAGTTNNAELAQKGSGGHKSDLDQNGSGNRGVIEQRGTGGTDVAAIDQSAADANSNEAVIAQSGKRGLNTADIDQGEADNRAEIRQEGDEGGTGAKATISQPGSASRASISQDGQAHVANASQAGKGNKAELSQKGSGGHTSDLDQNGSSNRGIIAQDGDGGANKAAIDQSAVGAKSNEAEIAQIGERGFNTADIDQAKSDNRAEIRQEGDEGGTGAKASISQPGSGSRASISQDGPALEASIGQNGQSNQGAIVQAGKGTSGKAQISTGGDARDNWARIEESTGGNIASIDQTSAGNRAEITTRNAAPQRASNEADIDQGGGDDNTARVEIGGDGVGRIVAVTQDAANSRADLVLSGAGDTIKSTVQQSGGDHEVVFRARAGDSGGLTGELQQDGASNIARARLEGDGLKLKLKQDGVGHSADVVLKGSGYSVTIEQTGDGRVFKREFDGPAEGGGDYSIVQKP
ncbi:hypothetical protein [Jiella marina]|uniref:hypothetical protein n=1 Tax=Jiella sp. LLJ827 TaxID=2917712 RepID=UPI002100CFDB|nr:hypothetical protein [Jiella sp. LLJ827]MCQ0986477.1 hypothetical protein [Jiella sp. LLJ827]